MANMLNAQQKEAIERIGLFVAGSGHCFILKGGAGTGKTTLIASLIQKLSNSQRFLRLLAPTGRAARILGGKTRTQADTIHRAIYSLTNVEVLEQAESANDPGLRMVFPLKRDDPGATLFIVDEASMVGDREQAQDILQFGSGRLLADLIDYARLGRPGRPKGSGAKIVFIGDPAQLPPVGETLSPALSSVYLQQHFGLHSEEFELTEVMRQAAGSAILDRATALREAIHTRRFNTFDCSPAGDEIVATPLMDSVEWVTKARRVGNRIAVLVTYSNSQALDLNRAVREQLWGEDSTDIRAGDLLLVNKNSPKMGLYNGDLVKVQAVLSPPTQRQIRLRGYAALVFLTFREVRLAYRNADGTTHQDDYLLLENLLNSRERDLTPLEQRALLVDFRQRHPDLKPGTAGFKLAISDDPYFNALQVKYGYAITCHKAQGGEWDTVVVDFSDGRGKRNEDYFRWAYTAITRAKMQLLTINAPRFDEMSDLRWGTQAVSANHPVPTEANANPPEDPDWVRYSFAAGQATLFTLHRKVRDAWNAKGIDIERLDHLQFCERYRVAHADARAAVQYHYKSAQTVSAIMRVPNDAGDDSLAENALTTMRAVLLQDNLAVQVEPEFIRNLRLRIESALAGTSIRLLSSRQMPYRLRLEFEENGHRTELDFVYNSKQIWTQVMEVGGPGTSRGLIDRLRQINAEIVR